jgi:hypothetical protein
MRFEIDKKVGKKKRGVGNKTKSNVPSRNPDGKYMESGRLRALGEVAVWTYHLLHFTWVSPTGGGAYAMDSQYLALCALSHAL